MLFTIVNKLHQTIEISAGPPPNISSPSPPTLIANPPPQYSTAVCSTPHVLTDTNASPTSSEEHPSNTEMVTLVFDAIPSQKLIDLAEHEFGSDEEVVVTLGQKQLVCLSIWCVSQCHYSQTAGRVEGSIDKEGMFANACIDLLSQF